MLGEAALLQLVEAAVVYCPHDVSIIITRLTSVANTTWSWLQYWLTSEAGSAIRRARSSAP